jgi:hypothetical protein
MTRPQVSDARNGLQIRRIAARTLKRLSWTAEKWWSSSLVVGCKENPFILKGLGVGRILSQDRVQWWVLLNMVTNLRTSQKSWNFLTNSFSRILLHAFNFVKNNG